CSPNVAANDSTFFAQALQHIAREIRRNCETNSLVPAAAAENRTVNAYEPAFGIHQCAARVAHVNCRVGLYEIFIINDAHAAAAHRADDPHGDCLPKPEGVAEGEDDIASTRFVAVCKCDSWQVFLVDF